MRVWPGRGKVVRRAVAVAADAIDGKGCYRWLGCGAAIVGLVVALGCVAAVRSEAALAQVNRLVY